MKNVLNIAALQKLTLSQIMMMEGTNVSDVDVAGGDKQEPEGRQQQQGLRPLRARRSSKT